MVTYRSPVCHIGTHHACTEAAARPTPDDVPVTHQLCDCPCHTGRRREIEVVESVTVSASSVRCGDVIVVGDRPRRVTALAAEPAGGRQARLDTGEVLVLTARSRLTATRTTRREVAW